jgi:tetratricopeptide (TPR) repeat protein
MPAAAQCSEFVRLMKLTQYTDTASKIVLVEQAIKAWTPADGTDNLSIAYNNMGSYFIEVHRDAEALAYFDKGLKIEPGDASMLLGRATTLSRLYRAPQALVSLDAAYKADPTWVDAVQYSWTLRLKLELYAEALPFCEEAARRMGPSVFSYQQLAQAYASLGRAADAEQAMEVSVHSPNFTHFAQADASRYASMAKITEAVVWGWGRDPERGKGLFDQLIEADPRKPELMILRGRLHLHLGELGPAIRDFNAILEIEPADSDALVFRAQAEERAGRPDLAAADRAAACRNGWTTVCPSRKPGRHSHD